MSWKAQVTAALLLITAFGVVVLGIAAVARPSLIPEALDKFSTDHFYPFWGTSSLVSALVASGSIYRLWLAPKRNPRIWNTVNLIRLAGMSTGCLLVSMWVLLVGPAP